MRWKAKDAFTVVTGATSGIGRCLTESLVRDGATVIATGRRQERLRELSDRLGERVKTVAGDLTDPVTRQRIVQATNQFCEGRLDLLVNNAGIGAIGEFAHAAPDRLRKVMEVNFFAPVELTRALLPALRRGRATVICNIGSVLGHRAVPLKSEYCASKFALHGWSDSLRSELSAAGIQVTLISPSTTESEFFDSLVDSDPVASSPRLGSWTPERVAAATLSAISARRSEVICSLGGKLLVYGDRLSPPLMNAILRRRRSSTPESQ
jgi:short-subunit dehydrogenase